MNPLKIFVKQKTLWLLLTVLAIAAFFRFYDLAAVPPGLYPDVAINGNDAITALRSSDFKIFYPENNGREGLFINLIALSFWLFGASVWAIKIVPALFGWLTVLGLYFLAKQLFSYLNEHHAKTIALLATFFIAISFWHVNFSRLGFRAIMVPFFLVWSFYFLYRGLDCATNNPPRLHSPSASFGGQVKAISYSVLAGLLFGLGFHTYIAFRIAPLILLVPIIFSLIRFWPKIKSLWRARASFWHFIKKAYLDSHGWLWDVFFLFLALAVLPLAIYFFQHPQDFMGRTGQVSIFATDNPAKTLLVSVVKSLGMFNVWGDCNWRHNYACQPELFWPIGILFLIGFILSLLKIFRPTSYRTEGWPALETHWLLLVWFGTMLLPEIMTNEGLPHSLRSIGTIPPVFIWTGLGGWWLAKKIRLVFTYNGSRLKMVGLTMVFAVFLFASAANEFVRYFLDWGQREETRAAFTQRLVDEGRYLASLPTQVQKFVLVNEGGVAVPYPDGLPMPAQTIIFFNRQTPNLRYFVKDGVTPTAKTQSIKTKDPLVFLPLKPDEQIFQNLAELFPAGRLEKINDFEVFKINF